MKIYLNKFFKLEELSLWIIIASFGPYITSNGLRTEHFLIYGILPLAVITLMLKKRTIISYFPLFSILLLLLFITLWTFLVTFIGVKNYESFNKVIAHLENYIQPIAIILISGAFINLYYRERAIIIFRKACLLLIILLLFNTVIAVISIFYDVSGWIKYFVCAPGSTGITVWSRAISMGRYSGIFNQPMESGLTYSLGLFSWIYFIQKGKSISIVNYLILFGLMLGGILSVSKVFILIGIPLFFIYLILEGRLKYILDWRFIISSILSVTAIIMICKAWKGFGYFARLFNISGKSISELIQLYTAGRFGTEHTGIKYLFTYVWGKSPFHGLGFAAATTLDNAYLEFLIQGGLVALFGYLFILAVIGFVGFSQCRRNKEGRFVFILFIFIVLSGVGAPVITINRFSTLFWLFLILLFSIIFFRQFEKSNNHLHNVNVGDESGILRRQNS
jgi:hypothetical protein